jgi:UDP-N-acetylmuramoyl-tripeptide--D-alanyl-D-alanine ligase
MKTSIEQLYDIFLQHPEVSTDTRTISQGCIFFALKGANFNGNDFASDALSKGAAFAVVDESRENHNANCLLVDDVLKALQQIARLHRQTLGEHGLRVVALTGSNGKTSTKELLARVLSRQYNTLATIGNLNNHIGVPLTLLRLNNNHEIAVIEMGANHQGEIQELCELALPDYGLITNIGLAHLEGFGGEEGVLKGKTELFRHLMNNNKTLFILNDDVRLSDYMNYAHVHTYGQNENAEVHGTLIGATPTVTYSWSWRNMERREVKTQMIGAYNLNNMLAATAVGMHLSVDMNEIEEAIATYVPSNQRSQLEAIGTNKVIVDCYNANPSSMVAAIDNLSIMPAANKIALLGDMFELGDQSAQEHQKIAEYLTQKLPNTQIIFVGDHFAKVQHPSAVKLSNSTAAKEYISKLAPQDALILIKGSRGVKMEIIAEALK